MFKGTCHASHENPCYCQSRYHQHAIEALLEIVCLCESVCFRDKHILELDVTTKGKRVVEMKEKLTFRPYVQPPYLVCLWLYVPSNPSPQRNLEFCFRQLGSWPRLWTSQPQLHSPTISFFRLSNIHLLPSLQWLTY